MRSKFKWILTLLVAFSMQFSFAQEKTITGVVSDASGSLPGVNVVVKGTARGASTSFDGSYSIKAKVGETLVYSFMGMSDISRVVGAENVINVSLQENAKELDAIVVTAVGIKRKIDAISSTQVVRAKELVQAGNPNVVQSLAGKVSGLVITNTGGGVKSDNRIVLRGNRSISGDNQALIVIDNAISSSAILQQLPPDVVENVTIIKGAQGAALYGEQGVNGVIIVTTKKGAKSDKMVVSVNSSVDFESVNFVAQRQTRYGQGWSGTHVTYENGAWGAEYDGTIKTVGALQANGAYFARPYSPIKDNIKKFFNTGTIIQNGISISAGNLNDGYVNLSVNKQDTDYIVEGDKLSRNSFLFKGGKKIGKLTLEGNVNYITEKTGQTTQTLLTELYQAGTNIPVEWFENSGNEGAWTSYYRNPYWMRNNIRFEDRQDFMNGILALNYEINKNININYNGNIRLRQTNDLYYRNGYNDLLKLGGGDHSTISQFDQSNSSQRNYYGDLMINFNYKLTEKLGFKMNLGQNLQDNFFKITSQGGDNLTIPGFYNIANVTGLPRFATNYSATAYNGEKGGLANGTIRSRRMGLFANVDFDYNDFLFLNLTARNDWSSTLNGAITDNYFYPSVGLSFVPTKIKGLNESKIINYAKISGSLVRNGNSAQIAAYGINNLYGSGAGYPFGTLSSFQQLTNPTDPAIKPEFMTTAEISGVFGFLNDRITLEGSYYQTKTTDLTTRISASSTSGLANLLTNVGKMTTTGYEIDLGFTPIKMENGLKWENRISYTTFKSIVNEVSDQSDEVALQNTGEVGIFAVKGQEFPLIKGTAYERDGAGRVIIDAATGNPLRTAEYKVLGKATPDYVINYNTSIDYKGLRLAVVMDYRTGHQFYSGTKDWLSWSGHLYESAINGRTGFIYPNSVVDLGSGLVPNSTVLTGGTSYTSFLSYFQDEFADIAENSVLDATALKVREISLSYSLPSKVLENTKLASVRFGVNARNPFIFLPEENRGYADPEFSNTIGNAQGISNVGKYPQTRTFGFNINVTF